MKNYFRFIGIIVLIFFGFFYTERVITVINEEDDIMIKLKSESSNYKVDFIDASINGNIIYPGINGREVDLDSSYKEMKKIGKYNEKLLVFNDVAPSVSIFNNYDKYIGGGNKKYNNVALVFKIENDDNVKSLFTFLEKKNIKANFFVSYDYLYDNIDTLFDNSNFEFYSYGNDGEYNDDVLIMSNNIISRKSNTADKCLSEEFNSKTLKVCSSNDMFTIYPSIINGTYSSIKTNIENGSIISFDIVGNNFTELSTIIDYINSRGYKISYLSELVNEDYK